jgi:twitching motility protein PilJ
MKATVKRTAGEGSRIVPTLAGLLLACIVLALLAFIHVSRQQGFQEQYVLRVAEQRVLAQELAKHALEAAQGDENAFPRLRETRDRFAQLLGELINGAPESKLPPSPEGVSAELQALDQQWAELNRNADEILVNQDAILSIGEFVGVITEFIPQLAEASDQVVRLLVQKNANPGQIYVAARQLMLAQRIENNVKRVLEGGAATAGAIDQFSQDAELFGRVLSGMLRGDEALNIERVRDPEGEAKLRQVAVLFKSINDHAEEIIDTTPSVLPALESAAAVTPASDGVGEAAEQLLAAYGTAPGLLRLGPVRVDQRVVNVLGGLALAFLVMLGLALLRDARRREEATTEQYQRNQAAIRRLLDEMGDLADGDLTVEATVTEDITGTIADSINYAIEAMRGLVQTINETSVKVSASAQESRATAMHLAEASEHQREQITSATGTMRDMNVAIEKMAADAGRSAEVAQQSLDLAAKGGDTVRRTIEGMDNIREQIQETSKRIKRLGESSQEIGNIVELIEDIADQTNILALNAAMQAAMAGDAGRGFAVVADEVQRLAERATNATKQIEALVQTIQADTSEAVSSMESTTTEVVSGAKLAEDAGASLHEIEEVSRDIAGITKNIADSAGEQARQAANINDTMSVIQEITTQTTEGTNHTAEAIGTLAELADDLRASVAGFRLPEA